MAMKGLSSVPFKCSDEPLPRFHLGSSGGILIGRESSMDLVNQSTALSYY